MRLAFMGSPDFAVPALRAIHGAGHTIAAVYCQPARPAGRGQAVRRCPVHVVADELGLPVRTPARLRTDPEAQAAFAALDLDVAVVAAYGLILPQAMLDAPRRGCLNIHGSLLPRWRGAAPIQAAILAGDEATGITIMQMEAGLDTGPMLLWDSVPITPETTTANLHDTLAAMGARLVLQALESHPVPVPQPEDGATYAPKLSRDDGRIDWTAPAEAIDRQVRAFDPWPGTFTLLAGSPLKVLAVVPLQPSWPGLSGPPVPAPAATGGPEEPGHDANVGPMGQPQRGTVAGGHAVPGTVLDTALTVACGEEAIRLTRVQLPGRGALDAGAFLRGHPVPPGTVLGQ